ncbi:aminoglycoside phosphotransferase family protein [Massilia antarctica]|uniref:aminoglycoside phosphotransferase family protein n=1 Tax=Massilia antarctica TaxID=2765360 RepID=UPI0006BB6F9E|nr:phosphotransferase [Massilia sp. H27-R4]MCY0915338.1 phosphotransferase [Massilia sp. H27-R4]CUI05799.1 COG3178: Predicted phosphotransferase related to Ser/Thr protein kinases [Janthinobacterium sp. CG23_2]CUU29585.1 COG3178: Predicted phosphotransferase related to Ser/Thr protein kinases [Janthinobacterium sp. CG23_2]
MSSSLPTTPATSSDTRLTQLTTWLDTLGLVQVESRRPASADASFRRYFRLDVAPALRAKLGDTLIAMDAPPERENVPAFIHVQGLLLAAGVSVPAIVAQDVANGFLLLSDLGSTTYLQRLDVDNAPFMYSDAVDALVKFQLASEPGVLPDYDRAFIERELNLFPEWFVGKHLGVSMTPAQSATLTKVFEAIIANNLAQQQVFMHRDFHSRNLMFMDQGNPGVLDFQDAVFGPVTYDLASLLRDAYVQWDEEIVLDWVVRYWQRAKAVGLPVNPDIDAFYQDFEFMALQRHLKILGLFCRLNYRDGKSAYLGDLPTVIDYVRKTCNRYIVLKPLARLLDAFEDKVPQVGYTF